MINTFAFPLVTVSIKTMIIGIGVLLYRKVASNQALPLRENFNTHELKF